VKLNIEVERAAKVLDQHRCPALRAGALDARLIRQPARNHAMHDAQHRADGFGLAGEQEAQWIRKTQDPLPHRPRAKHLFRKVTRTLGHAPCAVRRAPQITSPYYDLPFLVYYQ